MQLVPKRKPKKKIILPRPQKLKVKRKQLSILEDKSVDPPETKHFLPECDPKYNGKVVNLDNPKTLWYIKIEIFH